MATNWQFLNLDDSVPVLDLTARGTIGPKVTSAKGYSLAGAIMGSKGIVSMKNIWDAFSMALGSKVTRVTATGGITKGTIYVSPSVTVTSYTDIATQIQELGQSRMNDVMAVEQTFPELLDAIQAKRDFLDGSLSAPQLAAVLVESQKMPQIRGANYRNAILDGCRADVDGAHWAACWITGFLEDRATIEPQWVATASTALGI